jgi:hypothetical protein
VKKNSFGLLELEMADLEHFLRRTPLGPLEVNEYSCIVWKRVYIKKKFRLIDL